MPDFIIVKAPRHLIPGMIHSAQLSDLSAKVGVPTIIIPLEVEMIVGDGARSELERFHEEIHKILEKEE